MKPALALVACLLFLPSCCSTPDAGKPPTSSSRSEERASTESVQSCCAYREDFALVIPQDCVDDDCEVIWCDDAETGSSACSPPRGLRVEPNKLSTGTVLWVGFGERKVSEVRIGFHYVQWEGNPPVPDLASSYLEVKRSSADGFDPDRCPQSGYSEARWLNRTSSTMLDCTAEEYSHRPEEGDTGVLFRFRKHGTYGQTPILTIDDLWIDVVAADD